MKLKSPEKIWFIPLAVVGLLIGAILISSFTSVSDHSLICSLAGSYSKPADSTPTQLQAILHYATSKIVPQQSNSEIRVSFDVLQSLSPCNFLVFGLGHDSLMWSSFNPKGTTLFLEEDPKWVQTVLKDAPYLNAHYVRYPTQLQQADNLLKTYKHEECSSMADTVKLNSKCKLALTDLPGEVYDKEWDLIMIDAPRGYFAEAPGRMGAIYTAAVMARGRKKEGVTHVFLHDVDRRVEKMFAEEFLCRKYLVKGVGRLWHFEIPATPTNFTDGGASVSFC